MFYENISVPGNYRKKDNCMLGC